jgi:hypothetical protein
MPPANLESPNHEKAADLVIGESLASAVRYRQPARRERLIDVETTLLACCHGWLWGGVLRQTCRHRLNPGGDRQANSALHTVAPVRMRRDARTRAYVERHTTQGLSRREIAPTSAISPATLRVNLVSQPG